MSLTPDMLDKLDSRLDIVVTGIGLAEPEHLAATLARVARYQHLATVRVVCNAREKSGWIEYLLQMTFTTGGRLTVAVIQRKPGEQLEYHS